MPLSALGAFAVAAALLLGVAPARAESADDSRLRQIAGQAQSYTGEVRELLAKGADPNAPGQGGRTALHGAARIAAAETIHALLEAGGDPNRRDEDGNTPLHFAADSAPRAMSIGGEVDTIRVLLRAGGDPNRANARGRTPLHVAASSPHGEGAVRALVSGGADADRKDRSGDTPLHAAVGPHLGQPGVVRTLLNGGGDPSARNGDGLTVLQLFVRVAPDQGDTAALLIDAGADPDRKYPNGDAPLHAAIRSGGNRGKVDVAEALLSGGADPCVRDAKRYTPYQVAREGGAIHRALDRAGGHDFACDRSGVQITEVDLLMRAAKRSNVRSGPGTEHDRVGLLEVGDEVRVTGEAGDWLRIETPRGEAFVHASLLSAPQSARRESRPSENAEEISKLKAQIEASKPRYEEAKAAYYEAKESLKPALKWTSLDLVKCITARSGASRDKKEHNQQCRNRHAELKKQKIIARNKLQNLSDILEREGDRFRALKKRLQALSSHQR